MLRRVAQSQYDPQGLLRLDMVKWQLLMRRVSMKEKPASWERALDAEEEEEFLGPLEQHV
jgi:hypothetical protein